MRFQKDKKKKRKEKEKTLFFCFVLSQPFSMNTKRKRKQIDGVSSDLLEKKSKKPRNIDSIAETESTNTPTSEERCEIFVGNLPVAKGLKTLKKVFLIVLYKT